METSFTPIAAIAGGLLIGAAILVLFHTLGRIASTGPTRSPTRKASRHALSPVGVLARKAALIMPLTPAIRPSV